MVSVHVINLNENHFALNASFVKHCFITVRGISSVMHEWKLGMYVESVATFEVATYSSDYIPSALSV